MSRDICIHFRRFLQLFAPKTHCGSGSREHCKNCSRLFRCGCEGLRGNARDHLILSGGLGKSKYVQKCFQEKFESMRMEFAPEPQLTLCKGLLDDRFQKLKAGISVMNLKICRESYGTVCKVPFDHRNLNHKNRPKVKDSLDGKEYVHDSIEWFIRKVRAV